jgi:hypothetical protein
MYLQALADFADRHKEGLGLLGISAVVTMRPKLPWPFCRVEALEWCYEWMREALLTLLSFKGPLPHGAMAQSSEHTSTDAAGNRETSKESSSTGAAAGAATPPVA